MKIALFLLLYIFSVNTNAQNITFEQLEQFVINNNQTGKANESFNLIIKFIENNKDDKYINYKALILKSYVYKSLFNYTETLKTLDQAYIIGLQSNKISEVQANINLEKAYTLFDVLQYDASYKLMQILKKNNYRHIESADIAGMIMQEAYIDYLNKYYALAEKKYDNAIILMEKANPKNLPLIYGKKMELYLKTNQKNLALRDFKLGLESASKFGMLKYKIYMYEKLREQQMHDNDWQNAFKTYQKIDAMNIVYNANNKNNQLAILEKDTEIKIKEFDLKQSTLTANFLIILCVILLCGLYLLYRFLKLNKEKNLFLKKENIRIREELQILTSSLSSQGFTEIDLSIYKLSERQQVIIKLIRMGRTNKEIAAAIFISENTVKYHLKLIYDIINIENRAEFLKFINILKSPKEVNGI